MDLTPEQQSQLYLAVAGLITAVCAVFLVWAKRQVQQALKRVADATGRPELLQLGDAFDRVVTTSILYVAEQASKLAKGLIVTGPRTPQEKLALAEATARKLDPQMMANVDSETFAVVAEAKLASVRPLLADPVTVAVKSLAPRVSTNPASGEPFKLPAIPKASPVPVLARELGEDPPTNPGRKK